MPKFLELHSFYKYIPGQELFPIKHEAGHFNIFRLEETLIPQQKKSAYSRRDFFKVSLISGHSKLHYADRSVEIKGNTLVFTDPMTPYFWEILGERQTGYVCVFTAGFFSRFGKVRDYPVFKNREMSILKLTEVTAAVFQTSFENMVTELQETYIYKYDSLRAQLLELIHKAQKMQPVPALSQPAAKASQRIAGLFQELLERQFPIDDSNRSMGLRSAADFAGQLNLHVNHLNKALKEICGKTTSQLISDRMIQEAKTLLCGTGMSIAQIAWALGFQEANHFSVFFKTRVNCSPGQYRKSG